MLTQLDARARTCGLELHPDKTKLLSNTTRHTGRPKDSTVTINNMEIQILPREGSLKYLGRMIGFENIHEETG